jgi:hypothetical protein
LVPGVHRAGIFAFFLLPGGHPRCFTPELDPAAAEEAEGSICLGSVEEAVTLGEEGEVPEVSRRLYLRGAGIKALEQHSAAKRRAIMTV